MTSLADDLVTLFQRELTSLKSELDLFPDDESVWRILPGVSNSAGNLALHLAGNVQHFVGAVLGGTGYVRSRPNEFGQRAGTREQLHVEIDKAIDVVRRVLPALPVSRMDDIYPESVGGVEFQTRIWLIHLAVHAGFHLGQVGYLRRAVLADGRSSSPLPLAPLAATPNAPHTR